MGEGDSIELFEVFVLSEKKWRWMRPKLVSKETF
jgi:hypothetical protein